MTVGPGKYDEVCTVARELAGADGCILIILNGIRGNGLSIQSQFSVQVNEELLQKTPEILERLAADLRRDLGEMEIG